MKVAALLSGGKDSCYNMIECVRHGHQIVCLVNLCPGIAFLSYLVIENRNVNELDSYMYQTIGHNAVQVLFISFVYL